MSVPLLKVADLVNESVKQYEGVRTYIATGDVDCDHIASQEDFSFIDKPSRANLTAQSGDVIVARMKGTIKVLEIDDDLSEKMFSTGFAVLRPKKGKINSQLLKHFLLSPTFQNQKDKYSTGATQKAATNGAFKKITVPHLPEFPNGQEYVVHILDKAYNVWKKRKQAIDQLNTLLAASFIDMFGSPIGNSKDMPTKKIRKIGKVVTGNTPSRKKTEYYGDHIEWIKSDNINTPYHYLTKADESLSEAGKSVGRVVPKGAILVTCIAGSKSCIGNSAMTDREVAFNQQINAIIADDRYIKAKFLYTQLFIAKGLVQKASTNSMKGMVSKSKFEEIEVLCPPIEEQGIFETIFNEYFEAFERMNIALVESENIYKSLTQKAFEGSL